MINTFQPEIYIRPVDPSVRKAKILFLMGATHNTRSMFDLNTVEDSFAKILQNKNIETYTFDNIGLSNPTPGIIVGDQHQQNVELARKLISENNIDYVFGYSYGAIIVNDLLDDLPNCITGLLFLDPYTKLKNIYILNQIIIDGGDKRVFTTPQLIEFMTVNETHLTPEIQNDYVNLFSPSITLASYPGKYYQNLSNEVYQNFINRIHQSNRKYRMYFTQHHSDVSPIVSDDHKKILPNASHWVLVENDRYLIANDIEEFCSGH